MTTPSGSLQHWMAPPHWGAIDFVSDLHLSTALPLTAASFERYLLGTTADAVCLLGDVFEAWVGDDATTLPFEQQVTRTLARAAQRRVLLFMAGNRDFLVGSGLCGALGLQHLDDPTCLHAWGARWLLSHGDAQCLDDAGYQAFRAQVRQPAWQQAFLARPLADRLTIAQDIRARSMQRHAGPREGVETDGDLDAGLCSRQLEHAGARALIHGHTHRPGCHDVAPGRIRIVLSDWDFDDPTHPRGEVLRLRPGHDPQRLTPAQACQPG